MNPYGSSGQGDHAGGYGAQDYGQQSPYDQTPYGDGGYGAHGYGQASPYGDGYADNHGDVEMANIGIATGGSILDECRAIDLEIDAVDRNLEQLRLLQQQTLGDVTGGGTAARQLDALSADTMERYRSLTPRVRDIKSSPEASQPRNAAQVSRVDKRLKGAIQTYQGVEASFRSGVQEQIARQYRIVRPEADDQEVQRAVADERGDVFQRALMQSGRQGKASAALSAVQDRHEQIRKIERQMAELSQLFQDMDAVVVQQGAAVDRIEDQADQTVGDLQGAHKQVEIAVDKARAARKKKWICLGICVLIIIVIVVIVLAVLGAQGKLG